MTTSSNPINDTGIIPIQDQVLIRRDPAKTKTPSGLLYYPENRAEWLPTGTVLAVGPAVIDQDLVGKRVLFNPQSAVGRALVPDDREVDVVENHPERVGVIMLRSGDVPRETNTTRHVDKSYLGEIIGVIEED